MTGPLKVMTRHSSLSVVKQSLLNGRVYFQGYKSYNNFGSAVHHLFLLLKPGNWKLTRLEKRVRDGMIMALNAHPIVKKVMSQCNVREKKGKTRLFGIPFHFTPDGHGKFIGMDLKTTACTTLKDFIESAKKYGYFRQGDTYGEAMRVLKRAFLKEYWIFGVSKKFPHTVFPVLIQNHKEQMIYSRQELLLLLYIYKNYGNPVLHGKGKAKGKKKK